MSESDKYNAVTVTRNTSCVACDAPGSKVLCDACLIDAQEKRIAALEAENARLTRFAHRVAADLEHLNTHGELCDAPGAPGSFEGDEDDGYDPEDCNCWLSLRKEARALKSPGDGGET